MRWRSIGCGKRETETHPRSREVVTPIKTSSTGMDNNDLPARMPSGSFRRRGHGGSERTTTACRKEEGVDYTTFTDSQVAMQRVRSDAPGPGKARRHLS